MVRLSVSFAVLAVLTVLGLSHASAQLPPCLTGCGGGGGGTGYAVSVTPHSSAMGNLGVYATYKVAFTIKNTGTNTDFFDQTPAVTGNAVLVGQSNSRAHLISNASAVDTVTFSTTDVGTGTVTLHTIGEGGDEIDTGSYTFTIEVGVVVQAPVATNGRAVVHNRQPVIRAIYYGNGTYPIDTTTISLTWRGTDVTTLARFNRGLLEWEVDSAHWLGIGDSAQAAVHACDTHTVCTTTTVWVVLLNDNKPVIGLNTLPLEAPGSAFSAPFGPGLSLSGADVGTGFSMPAYTTRGAARSAGLIYSTRTSYPRALVPIEVELPWPNGAVSQLVVKLLDQGVVRDSVVVTSPSCATGSAHRCRVGLQEAFPSGTYSTPTRKWLTVDVQVDSGSVMNEATDSMEVVVVDRRQAVYGSGWWPAGVSQLVGAGSDRVLVGPDGTAAIYRGVGDSVYLAPPGVFTRLAKVGNTWELHPRGTAAKVVFDSLGRVVRSVDAHGNADTVVYSGTSTQVTELADPFGHHITFGYTSGVLASFTDPGSRVTKVVIDGTNHLVADTVPSANGHTYFASFAYHLYSDSGLVLTSRTGVLGDAATVTYDSTFTRRPTKVTLATVDTGGGSASPVIQYAAAEAQGFHALAATSAATVTVTDPKGNWTTSLLNRWGAARKTWDVVDTLARTSYTPEGLVQWTEGKVQDSSRVTTVYDNLRRAVKSYVVRGVGDTLRLDSLVYDTASRVVTSIDARGKVSQVAYDAYGDVTQTIDPNADTSRAWFEANGLLDSTRAPGNTASMHFKYESTWQNVDSVFDPTGMLVSASLYDPLGRDTATDAKVRVLVTNTSSSWQWRRTETFFNPINQVDSSRLLRTSNCTDPCNSPPGWPLPSDTTKTVRVANRFNRAGRDSLRFGDRGAATGHGVLYLYDALGRLRSRHPWWPDSTAVRDTFVVDAAGNTKQSITRRGDTITVAFDTRNRDTATVIPGVGTLHHGYGGPGDQVNREWYTNLVDTIGTINPTQAWVFNQRGLLVADSAFTGSTTRVTTYAYDRYDRDTAYTDAVGSWRTRFETARGIPDTLLAGTGDSLIASFDGQDRVISTQLNPTGVAPLTMASTFDNAGTLDELDHAVTGDSAFNPGSWVKDDNIRDGGPPLAPIWVYQQGHGAAEDTLRDSSVYDGWQRLTAWVQYKDGVIRFNHETYTYDRDGNISAGGGETYDTLTDRLVGRTGWTYAYDRAGNLTQAVNGANTWTYAYDALNELRAVRLNGTLIARYAYDGSGRRIAKRVYSSVTGGTVQFLRFVYHGANVAYETDSTGTLTMEYVWAGTDQLVSFANNVGTHYNVVTDMLGSVRAVVGRNGTSVSTTDYRPYGQLLGDPGVRYAWTGREYDAELGFYYFRARYYDPGSRRFVQEDPAGYMGGPNLYAYAEGSPLNLTDPTGLDALPYLEDNCYYEVTFYSDNTWSVNPAPVYCLSLSPSPSLENENGGGGSGICGEPGFPPCPGQDQPQQGLCRANTKAGSLVLDASIAPQAVDFINSLVDAGASDLSVTSSFRSSETQAMLFLSHMLPPAAASFFGFTPQSNPVAVPGTSNHEAGFAFDLNWKSMSPASRGLVDQALTNSPFFTQSYSNSDPVHMDSDTRYGPWGSGDQGKAQAIANNQAQAATGNVPYCTSESTP